MTQEEFVKLKDKYSKKWADAHFNSFKEYDWDKFIRVEDASTQFNSTRRKYALYKDNVIITPYLDETGNYKSYQGKDNILMAQYAEFDSEGDYNDFYFECQKDISTRWNIWEFTLYSSGEYESNFVWDEQAVQDVLISAIKKSFATLYTNAIYKINEVFLPKKEWQTATLVVEFAEGKIQPLKISIPFEGKILDFSVGIENIERTKKDTNISDYELDYALSNQENIKDKLYGSWTKVTMILHQNIFGGKFNPENYIFE